MKAAFSSCSHHSLISLLACEISVFAAAMTAMSVPAGGLAGIVDKVSYTSNTVLLKSPTRFEFPGMVVPMHELLKS